MFRIERINQDGTIDLMMASPHRVTIDDIQGPPGPSAVNQGSGAHYMNGWPTPGNLSVFSGWKARVRWNDVIIEEYKWAPKVPVNPNDPDTEYLWGWELETENRSAVPFQELYPLSFVG